MKRAKISAYKEPAGLILQNGKRPDGVTLIPWSGGKALACDVTIPDMYAASHQHTTSLEAGSTAKHAARLKTTKYQELIATDIFCPIPIETAGSWDEDAL